MVSRIHNDILALALLLRLLTIRMWPLWYDEIFTASISRLSFPEMIRATAGDVHPPLYYTLTWLVNHAGLDGDMWLRLPSLIFSVLLIAVVWQVQDRLGVDPKTQIYTGLGLAVIESQLWYAQEARMYALLALLVWLAALLILDRRWGWLAVVNLAILYTHNYALFFLPVLAALSLYELRKPGRWLWSFIIPGLLWLPWAYVLYTQMQATGAGYWLIQPIAGEIIYSLFTQFFNFGLPYNVKPLIPTLVIGLLTFGLVMLYRHKRTYWVWLLAMSFGALALASLASIIQPVLLFRGLFPTSPALIWLVAQGMAAVKVDRQRYLMAFVAPIILVSLYFLITQQMANDRNLLNRIITWTRSEMQSGDVIYHATDSYYLTWLYVAPDLPQYMAPPCLPTAGGLSVQTMDALGFRIIPLNELAYKRAFVIVGVHPFIPDCQIEYLESLEPYAKIVREVNTEQGYFQIWQIENASP